MKGGIVGGSFETKELGDVVNGRVGVDGLCSQAGVAVGAAVDSFCLTLFFLPGDPAIDDFACFPLSLLKTGADIGVTCLFWLLVALFPALDAGCSIISVVVAVVGVTATIGDTDGAAIEPDGLVRPASVSCRSGGESSYNTLVVDENGLLEGRAFSSVIKSSTSGGSSATLKSWSMFS